MNMPTSNTTAINFIENVTLYIHCTCTVKVIPVNMVVFICYIIVHNIVYTLTHMADQNSVYRIVHLNCSFDHNGMGNSL